MGGGEKEDSGLDGDGDGAVDRLCLHSLTSTAREGAWEIFLGREVSARVLKESTGEILKMERWKERGGEREGE